LLDPAVFVLDHPEDLNYHVALLHDAAGIRPFAQIISTSSDNMVLAVFRLSLSTIVVVIKAIMKYLKPDVAGQPTAQSLG